jgi:NDP-sugar pyrophosphorylase family protein
VNAVVMAAGEGRRLRPLTERWPKPVLPIDGRPVIATLLRQLGVAGFTSVTVVVGHLADRIEALVGDGAGFGVDVRYAYQPEPVGSADAVRHALAAEVEPPLLVTAADTVYTRDDVRDAAERWLASDAAGALAVREVPVAELPDRSFVRAEGDRLLEIVEKPAAPPTGRALAGAPLWFLSAELCASLDELPGPPYELATAAQRAIDAGKRILALEIGPTRDLTRPEDVIDRNFPYLSG